jgi:hypothetical protein
MERPSPSDKDDDERKASLALTDNDIRQTLRTPLSWHQPGEGSRKLSSTQMAAQEKIVEQRLSVHETFRRQSIAIANLEPDPEVRRRSLETIKKAHEQSNLAMRKLSRRQSLRRISSMGRSSLATMGSFTIKSIDKAVHRHERHIDVFLAVSSLLLSFTDLVTDLILAAVNIVTGERHRTSFGYVSLGIIGLSLILQVLWITIFGNKSAASVDVLAALVGLAPWPHTCNVGPARIERSAQRCARMCFGLW